MSTGDRSNAHPSATWSECRELIEKLDEFGRKPVSTASLAESFGLKNPKTKSLQTKITSSRLFGLVSVKNGTIALTDSGRDILHPTTVDVRPLERECFARPKLYRELLGCYDGKSLPREDLFENILEREYGISSVSKKRAAMCFKESAEELGFLVNGVILNEGLEEGGSQSKEDSGEETRAPSGATTELSLENRSIPKANATTSTVSHECYISVPATKSGSIEIRLPADASLADCELARQLLEVLIKKKKDETEGGD